MPKLMRLRQRLSDKGISSVSMSNLFGKFKKLSKREGNKKKLSERNSRKKRLRKINSRKKRLLSD